MASDVKAGNNTSHAKIKNKPTGDTVMADSNDYEFYVGSESKTSHCWKACKSPG